MSNPAHANHTHQNILTSWYSKFSQLFKNRTVKKKGGAELKELTQKLFTMNENDAKEAIEFFLKNYPQFKGEYSEDYVELLHWAIDHENMALLNNLLKRYDFLKYEHQYPKGVFNKLNHLTINQKNELDYQLGMLGIEREYHLPKRTKFIEKLILMIEHNRLELLEKFLNTHRKNTDFDINAKDKLDWPILFIALEKDNIQAFELLVKHGADLEVRLHLPLAEFNETSLLEYVAQMPQDRRKIWQKYLEEKFNLIK